MSKNSSLKGNFSHAINTTKKEPYYQIIYEVMPIAVIIILVNIMVFYLFFKSRRLRSPTNCLLLSLAVCDFTAGFICIPLFLTVAVPAFKTPQFELGNFNVVFNNFIAITAAYHILAITLERYFCISRPFVHRQLTKWSVLKVALLVWFVAAVVGFIPYAWSSLFQTDKIGYYKRQFGHVVFCLAFVFVIPCVLIVASQTLTFKAITKGGAEGLTASKSAQRKAKNEKKCLIIFALMAFIYVVCWLPWFVLSLCFSFWFPLSLETYALLDKLAKSFVILRYITSIVNPLLYTFFKQDFLKAFKRLVLKKKPVKRGRFNDTTTTSRFLSLTMHQRRLIPSASNSNDENVEDTQLSAAV